VAAPLVQIRGLTKAYYGQAVLDGVSFDIAEGEVFGYIGPNGAGKTTTLKILAGLITKYQGQVLIDGVDIAADRVRSHHLIGFLPQGVGFQAWRTVDSALDSLAELSGVPAEVRARRISALLERFDLLAARRKKVKELSGGMTQKLGLIQALLHEPKLLVLDEPLEGLDPPSRALLKDVIRERQRAGTTVLFSSHILSDVEDVADRVGILHAGAIATSGSLRDLLVAFGLPLELELELSARPADLAFLGELGAVAERKPGTWRVTLPAGADVDAAVHTAIERTLAGGGRLRRIGLVEPDLDDLFASYLVRGARAA
jgi:ABC-2 type transport system ATP-binding protein